MRRKKRKRSDLKVWANRYKEWAESKQTQWKYCECNAIPLRTFKWKIREAKEKGLISEDLWKSKQRRVQDNPPFIPVSVGGHAEVRDTEPYCEIIFSGGHRVTLTSNDSWVLMRELIQQGTQR